MKSLKKQLNERIGEAKTIAMEDGFYLTRTELAEGGYEFEIIDEFGIVYDYWESDKDDRDGAIDRFYTWLETEAFDYLNDETLYGYDEEEEEKEPSSWMQKWSSTPSTYHYEPPKKKTGFYDEYTKSDTLVFHKTDNSTDMLGQIYQGKNWDVIRSTYDLDQEELFRVVDAHDRIVCLGHGSGYGLIGMFGPEMAPHFKDKKLFIIWCNADAYFNKYGIGHGQFITGNMPSEVWECRSAGCGSISTELMLENITYWSKLCADVTERCLHGDVKSSVDYIRKNYLEKYGNHPVTIYNCNRTQALGEPQPLPQFTFKGKPLEGKDIPYEGYNQEEFLKDPMEKIPYTPPKEKPFEPKEIKPGEVRAPYKQLSLFDDEDEDVVIGGDDNNE